MTGRALAATQPTPSLWTLFRVWLAVGMQSFGGGSVTRYLIWQAVVERHGWITDDEFTDYWAISHIPPGINLLALTTLLGWRLGRAAGVAICLLGLLLPSVSITILFTAIYALIRGQGIVQAALRGVVPATVGISLILAWRLLRPLIVESRAEGKASLTFSLTVLGASILLGVFMPIPIFATLILAGVVGAVAHWWWTK